MSLVSRLRLLLFLSGAAVTQTLPLPAAEPPTVFPSRDWTRGRPEANGYSSRRFEALRGWLATQTTESLVVVVGGRIIFEYGDSAKVTKIASVRKSILGLLYGQPVVSGKIDLRKTVKELGLQEKDPFLPIEERATLEQLLVARSGVYLPSGNEELDRLTPRRGALLPGTTYSYNNWDFNAAGTAYEKLTGRNLYDALEQDLARPLGMQDFDRSRQVKNASPGSVHPEYAMYLSTRDMARIGLLMLRGGKWEGKQLVPGDWCRHLTTLVTRFEEMNPVVFRNTGQLDRWGYGTLWWVWDGPTYPGGVLIGPMQGAYSAMGAGGQYITVLPAADMVIVHKVNIDDNPDRRLGPTEYDAILAMIISCYAPTP